MLLSLLFLKEKQTGKFKDRLCINGAPQRAYIPKEDAASPTVSTKLTNITAAKVTSKKRKVRCYNIPSEFVNRDVYKDVLMVLKSELAEMMFQIAPQVSAHLYLCQRAPTKYKRHWLKKNVPEGFCVLVLAYLFA